MKENYIRVTKTNFSHGRQTKNSNKLNEVVNQHNNKRFCLLKGVLGDTMAEW